MCIDVECQQQSSIETAQLEATLAQEGDWLSRLIPWLRVAPYLAFEINTPKQQQTMKSFADELVSLLNRQASSNSGQCNKKSKEECNQRYKNETAFCREEYGNYPKVLYPRCMERAMWRWNNCLRGLPDPGPLDPLDPNWSPD